MKATEIFSVYSWLGETFRRHGELTLHDLNELWVKTEMSGGVPMSRHTFTRHRQSMQEMFGFNIVCHKRTNSYSIADDDLHLHNDMQTWMLETLSIGNMLRESASMKDRIEMEHIPAGMPHLRSILNAMKENRRLQLTYRKFGQAEARTFAVEPLAIKVFKQRWYLVAEDHKRDTPSVYALDRMEAVEELPARFDFPTDFSVRTFFRDCYGVLRDPQCEPQRIVLRAYYPFAHYLRTLPLHPSQQELTATPQYADFELYLRPTFDFKQELLAQGREVEVLQPASLREEMKQMIRGMMGRYEDCEN